MLCRFSFELSRCFEVGYVCKMYVDAVSAHLPTQLTDTLDKRKAFDIADSTTYLGNDKVEIARIAEIEDILLYFVRNMWDYLHGGAEVVATTLFVYHLLIDSPAGNVIYTLCLYV